MPTTPERPRGDHEAALIAAAASGELTATEQEEYDALVAADPAVADEVTSLRDVLARLDGAGLAAWDAATPSGSLAASVLDIPAREAAGERGSHRRRSRPVRWLPAAAAAVVLLVVGGVLGALLGDRSDVPPQGPPGTLGAVELVEFEGAPAGVDIEASVVAHTWGTETVLSMAGWPPGDRYQVVLVGTDGARQDSGTFLGSGVRIECRMNAALLREEVAAIQIRDARGRVVATSDLPAVA